MSETVESLKSVLWEGAPWVALTGAGISSASGIPTYRDHQGKWLGSNPIQHDEFIRDPPNVGAIGADQPLAGHASLAPYPMRPTKHSQRLRPPALSLE